MSTSALAVLKGFLEFTGHSYIAGVIFNNISQPTYEALEQAVLSAFGGRVQVFGYLPKLPKELELGSRRLGLVTAAGVADLRQKLSQLAVLAERHLHLE